MLRYFASLSALALFAACAFPSIDFRPADEDDTGPSSSSGGLGGMGGGVGGSPSVGGGGGEPLCTVGAPDACPMGEKCSWNEATMTIDCVPAGNRPPWSRCVSDSDCELGTFCDMATEVCHPVCQSAAQCGSDASQCIPAMASGGLSVPGIKVCTSNCNPYSANPCSDQFGKTTCYYNANGSYWDCIKTLGLTEGTTCNAPTDCDRGLVCPADNLCLPWCSSVGDPFCSGIDTFCYGVNPTISWEQQEVGICGPL